MTLDEFIKIKKITIKTVADEMGLSQQSIYNYLTCKRYPRPEIIDKFEEYTNGLVTSEDFNQFRKKHLSRKETAALMLGENKAPCGGVGRENINNEKLA